MDLSSRCSILSRALSPKHVDKSAGLCSGWSSFGSPENQLQFKALVTLAHPLLDCSGFSYLVEFVVSLSITNHPSLLFCLVVRVLSALHDCIWEFGSLGTQPDPRNKPFNLLTGCIYFSYKLYASALPLRDWAISFEYSISLLEPFLNLLVSKFHISTFAQCSHLFDISSTRSL